MKEHEREEEEESSHENQRQEPMTDERLGDSIARVLGEQAEQIHFTPELREKIMQRLKLFR